MRDEPTRRLTRLFPLVAIWMALMVLLASPALGEDDDNNDDPPPVSTTTTTTSAPSTTTTTVPPPPTTTTTVPPPPPPPITTTTHRSAPTTTTSTTATTTTVVPRDESWEEQRLESWVATPTTTTTTAPEAAAGTESKDAFVLSIGAVDGGNGDDGHGDSGGRGSHIAPREGLTVAFRTAVEVIESQLLKALVLGILVAGFVMVGVDKRQAAPATEAKVLRSFTTST